MKRILVISAACLLLMGSAALCAEAPAMSDADLGAAFKLCIDAQSAGGGTLAENPQMAKMCTPIIAEADKRRKAALPKAQQPSIDQLQRLLQK